MLFEVWCSGMGSGQNIGYFFAFYARYVVVEFFFFVFFFAPTNDKPLLLFNENNLFRTIFTPQDSETKK